MAEVLGTNLYSDANLIEYYRLEDLTGKNGNTLTNNNSVAFNPAKYGNGADLGSANSSKYMNRLTNMSIAGNGTFAISFWIKLNAEIASGTWTFFQLSSQTTADRYLNFNYDFNGGTIRLQIDNAGNTVNHTVSLGTSSFHNIVFSRNGSSSTSCFLDGVDLSMTVAQGGVAGGANRFIIGYDGGVNYTSAIIDDLPVFNRVLTAADASYLYNELMPGYQGVRFINQPQPQVVDPNSFFFPSFPLKNLVVAPPTGLAAWVSRSIAQPYFPKLNLDPILQAPVNVSTYFKNIGWYKVAKPQAIWSKVIKPKIISG